MKFKESVINYKSRPAAITLLAKKLSEAIVNEYNDNCVSEGDDLTLTIYAYGMAEHDGLLAANDDKRTNEEKIVAKLQDLHNMRIATGKDGLPKWAMKVFAMYPGILKKMNYDNG